jgi:signal peptidase I
MPGAGPYSVRQCPRCGASNPSFTIECACGERLGTTATSALSADTKRPVESRRRAGLAGVLGFVWPGVGYLYAGEILRGVLLLLLLPPVELAIFLLAVLVPLPVANIVIPAALWLALHALLAYGAYHAACIASPFGPDRPVPFFSRWYGCLVGVVLGVGPNLLWAHAYRTTFMEAYKIPSGGMEPTLLIGDHLLAVKWAYGWREPVFGHLISDARPPKRGDLVIFRYPQDRSRVFIKRCIGLPGETVEVRGRAVLIDGNPLDEPYAHFLVSEDQRRVDEDRRRSVEIILKSRTPNDPRLRDLLRSADNWGPQVVPVDRYFVLGDNRDNSRDSRFWGFVPQEDLLGRALVVYWSYEATREEYHRSGVVAWVEDALSAFGRTRWQRTGRRLK